MANLKSAADGTRLDVFLDVVPTDDGYIEKGVGGEHARYFRHNRAETIELQYLRVLQEVDPRTGSAKYRLTAVPVAEFRAIGAEKSCSVRRTTLTSSMPPGQAVLRQTYGTGGHALGATLDIGLSDAALAEIVAETRSAPTARGLDVQLREPRFCGTDPDLGIEIDFAKGKMTHLLPWWSEQRVNRETQGQSQVLVVEWSFEIGAIIVCPEHRGRAFGPDERELLPTQAVVKVEGPVGVYRLSESGEDSRKGAQHPFQGQESNHLAVIQGLRAPLYWIAICAAAIALKLIL